MCAHVCCCTVVGLVSLCLLTLFYDLFRFCFVSFLLFQHVREAGRQCAEFASSAVESVPDRISRLLSWVAERGGLLSGIVTAGYAQAR